MVKVKRIGIVAGGPQSLLADLSTYQAEIDYWIGCDRGSLYLLANHLPLDLAIGDFDSVDEKELKKIKTAAKQIQFHPVEKDLTDLELAINQAINIGAEELIIFGVSGGRKDHELAAIFLLEQLAREHVRSTIIDRQNIISFYLPGKHRISTDQKYNKVSFLALTEHVTGLTLTQFYYELKETTIRRGDSLTLSNHLIEQPGYFSFDSGILIVIKSSEHI